MKLRFFSLISILACVVLIFANSLNYEAHTHATGAPAGRCGSIADPLTCSNCHAGGPNTVQPGWITSNIPPYGYVPGTTYTITATATFVGRSKFGFEISPQDPTSASTSRGTCIITNADSTKLITGTSGRKYVTHQTAGTTGTADFHTWTFDWTAPTTGIDSVIFYGAFLCSDSSNSSGGDITYKSSLTVYKDITTGMEDNLSNATEIFTYPNPASDHIHVTYKTSERGKVEIKLYDYHSRMIALLMSENKSAGVYNSVFKFPFDLHTGVYLLEISTETARSAQRIFIQR